VTKEVAPLENRLGYLLKTAYGQLAELVDAALSPFELTARQLAVLSVIARHDALSQIELSERLAVDRTTIVAMLDALEARDWIERRRDARDRRRNVLVLTADGAARVADAEKARAAAESGYLSALRPSDADAFLASLRTVAEAGRRTQPPVGEGTTAPASGA
jgi:DNA-binding MarR family transcriptional regulator